MILNSIYFTESLKHVYLSFRISSFRNKSVDKWQRKTQVTTGAAAIKGKLHAFNQVCILGSIGTASCVYSIVAASSCEIQNKACITFFYLCRILVNKLPHIWGIQVGWSSRCNNEDQPLAYLMLYVLKLCDIIRLNVMILINYWLSSYGLSGSCRSRQYYQGRGNHTSCYLKLSS